MPLARTIASSPGPSGPGPARSQLVWFLHFHKAGGTSLVRLARTNGETFHRPDANGNPLSAHGKTLRLWELSADGLSDFVGQQRARGVSFVATEWGVPDLGALSAMDDVRTVTVLRHPVDRIRSNYAFDYLSGYTTAPSIADYVDHHLDAHTHSNYYARQLLGSTWRADEPQDSTLDRALARARLIDDVLLLQGASPFAPLGDVLGWSEVESHQLSSHRGTTIRLGRAAKALARGKVDLAARRVRGVPSVTGADLVELRRRNSLDLALFEALELDLAR
jgi:hypothetical protein